MNIPGAKISFRQSWFTLFLLTASYLQIFSSIVLAATSFNVTNLTAGNSVTAGYARFSNIQLNDAGQGAFTGVNPTTGRAMYFFGMGPFSKTLRRPFLD